MLQDLITPQIPLKHRTQGVTNLLRAIRPDNMLFPNTILGGKQSEKLICSKENACYEPLHTSKEI